MKTAGTKTGHRGWLGATWIAILFGGGGIVVWLWSAAAADPTDVRYYDNNGSLVLALIVALIWITSLVVLGVAWLMPLLRPHCDELI